jgi:hypothetical protein
MSWALRISCVTMHGKYVDMRHPCNKQSSTLRARTSSSFRLFHILSIRLAKMHSISATPTKLRTSVRRIALITVLLLKCLCRSKCAAKLEARVTISNRFRSNRFFLPLISHNIIIYNIKGWSFAPQVLLALSRNSCAAASLNLALLHLFLQVRAMLLRCFLKKLQLLHASPSHYYHHCEFHSLDRWSK